MTETMMEKLKAQTVEKLERDHSFTGCYSDRCTCLGLEATMKCQLGVSLDEVILAILQALREPSVEMLVAALPNVQEPTDADKRLAAGAFNVLSPDRTDRAWQAINAGSELARDWRNMIDHIIKEGK